MRLSRCSGLLGLALLGSIGGSTWAQDAQYWTNQHGNRARLLGGAVIGSSTDLSAVYYNPGALALIENPELVLSANVFQYTRYGLEVNEGNAIDTAAERLGAAPSLVAGEIKFGFLGETRFGYSVLTRYKSELRLEGVRIVSDPPDSLGVQYFGSDVDMEHKLTETWIGFTLARDVGGNWGIGVSPYLTVRSQRASQSIAVQTVDMLDLGTAYAQTKQISFYDWRILLKIGASATYGAWRCGATVTTPSLGLFGRGDTYFNRTLIAQDGPGAVVADLQEDLVADYVAPWAIGAGVAYERGQSALNFALEYFFPIAKREVLANEPFTVPGSEETVDINLLQEAKAVLNFAVGWQRRFSETLEAYAGFRTDFSSKPDNTDSIFPLSDWNVYHLSGGTIFDLGRSHFTLGGVVAWGRTERIKTYAHDWGVDEVPPLTLTTGLKYFRLTAILGFSIFFD